MENPEKIADLLFRYLRNELSASEKKELDDWRRASLANEETFKRETDPEYIREGITQMNEGKDKVWNKLVESFPELSKQALYKPGWTTIWIAAAVIAIIISAGWWLLQKNDKKAELVDLPKMQKDISHGGNHATLILSNGRQVLLDTAKLGLISGEGLSNAVKSDSGKLIYDQHDLIGANPQEVYNTLVIPRGGTYHVLLSDGTNVWLNASSTLKYPTMFNGKERRVELIGEGYFEVAKKNVPFFVSIDKKSVVEVLGTHFDIMAYDDEPIGKTTLLEGKIKFTNADKTEILSPGDQLMLQKDDRIYLSHDTELEDVIAWKNGRTFFKQADIPTIMRMISRWYDVDVEYKGNIPERSITGGISRNSNLSELLEVLRLNNIHFTVEGKKIIVEP